MAAAHYKADNLCAILDHNGLQIDGWTDEIMCSVPLMEKWQSFGWNVICIDGHDFNQIIDACEKARQWRETFPDYADLAMAVNLSGKQFNQPDLVAQIEAVLKETAIDPSALKLEITESVLMEDRKSALTALRKLRALNIQLSIDDFGTGYSSFSHLQTFPVDTLKIDRSFISRMGLDGGKTEIVDTIVTLGKTLGLTVVAEGVETAGQLSQLRARHCEYAQGFLFARPMPGAQAESMLLRNPRW